MYLGGEAESDLNIPVTMSRLPGLGYQLLVIRQWFRSSHQSSRHVLTFKYNRYPPVVSTLFWISMNGLAKAECEAECDGGLVA